MSAIETLVHIQALLSTRPELAQPLVGIADADTAAATLARIARENGIAADIDTIRADIAAAAAAAESARTLPDAGRPLDRAADGAPGTAGTDATSLPTRDETTMTTDDAMTRIQALFAERPELARPLQGITEPDAMAEALARVAADHAIPLDAGGARRWIAATLAAAPAPAGELSDAELDRVTGGAGPAGSGRVSVCVSFACIF